MLLLFLILLVFSRQTQSINCTKNSDCDTQANCNNGVCRYLNCTTECGSCPSGFQCTAIDHICSCTICHWTGICEMDANCLPCGSEVCAIRGFCASPTCTYVPRTCDPFSGACSSLPACVNGSSAPTGVPTTHQPTSEASPTHAPTSVTSGIVTPFFTCWYYTFLNQTRTQNLLLGYNSTLNQSVNIPYGPANQVVPLNLQGSQPELFDPGLHLFVFSVRIQPVPLNAFSWSVLSQSVTVGTNDLVDSNRCDHRFEGECIDWPHFCEDSSYCNGREFCHNGFCQTSTQPIQCLDHSVCNETVLCLPIASQQCNGDCLFTQQCVVDHCQNLTCDGSCPLTDPEGCFLNAICGGCPANSTTCVTVCLPGEEASCNPSGGTCTNLPDCGAPVSWLWIFVLIAVVVIVILLILFLLFARYRTPSGARYRRV